MEPSHVPEPEPELQPSQPRGMVERAKPQLCVKFQVAPLARGERGPSGSDALEALGQVFCNQFKTYRVAGSKLVSYSVAQDGTENALGALQEEQPVRPAPRTGRGVWIPFQILPRRKKTDVRAEEALRRLEAWLSETSAERSLVCGVPAHDRTRLEWERHTRVLFDVLPAAGGAQIRTPDKALEALRRALAAEPRVRTSNTGTTARVTESILGEDTREEGGGDRWAPMDRPRKHCTPLAERIARQLMGLRELNTDEDDGAAFGLQLSDLEDLLDSDGESAEDVEEVDCRIELGHEELIKLEMVLRQGGDEKLAPVVSAYLSEVQLQNLLQMSARSRRLAVGGVSALEISLRSHGVATELEIVRQIAAAQNKADGNNPVEVQLQPLANRVAGAFTLEDFDELLSEVDELELQAIELAARRQKVCDSSPLWFGTVQVLMEKASDVLEGLSANVCRYCVKCEDATEFATDGFSIGATITQPWIFAGFECGNRHPDFFYRDEVPNRIMDTLYAAREVHECTLEAEKAQARRDAYAVLLQSRREHHAAAVIQSFVRKLWVQRWYLRTKKMLIRAQATARGRYDRRLVQQHRRSLPKFQAHWRRKLVGLSYRNISRAPKATRIQALWRGHRARNRLRRRSCVAAWPAARVAAVIQWLQLPKLKTGDEQQLPTQIVLRLTTPPVAAQWKSDDPAARITFRRKGDVLITVGASRQQWCTHRGVLEQATVFAEMIAQRLDLFHNLYGTDAERLIGSQRSIGRFLRVPISLPDEDPAAFASLMHFMYGLPVRLSIVQTVQFYDCADRYGAIAAMRQSFFAITQWAAEGKCCEVYDAARTVGAKRVAKYCWKHIVRLLEYLVADPASDIETLSSNSLLSIIQSTELVVRSEEIMLKLLLRWVMVDLHNRFHSLAGCLMCIQWSLLPFDILQAAVTDEVKLAQMLRLGQFARWYGSNSVTALLARLRESHIIVRAVDRALRSEIFDNVVELSKGMDKDHSAVHPMSSLCTLATSARHYTSLQTIEAERAAMEEYLAGEVDSSGTAWYLVAHRWMVSWLEHVNYWERCLHPGPIDNTCLLTSDGLTRLYLQEGVDFDLVSETVWHMLVGWYGGGPELKRWSYWERLHGYSVEVSPTKLRVGLVVNDAIPRRLKHMEASTFCSIGDLVDQTCRLHGLQRSDVEELAVWEWSSCTKHVRWSRRLPRRQIQAIEARTLKDVAIGDGDTICLKLTAKSRASFSSDDTAMNLQPQESRKPALELMPVEPRQRAGWEVEIPSRPKLLEETAAVRNEAAPNACDSHHRTQETELSSVEDLSTSEDGLSTAEEDSSGYDELFIEHHDDVDHSDPSVVQFTPAGHVEAAGKRKQPSRVMQHGDRPEDSTESAAAQHMTVARMLALVQKELGIQPDDEQDIATAVQHVEAASGITMSGTLKDRLQNVAVELGIVRVSGPWIADAHPNRSMVPQLAKLQSQMDQVLGLLTGQSQREEVQQMIKAVSIYERMSENRREASRMNATKEARRLALPQRPVVASPVATVASEPCPSPQPMSLVGQFLEATQEKQPSSLVDRLLEAKQQKAVEKEKAETLERSGVPPPPPCIACQPVQEVTCLQAAIQLLQRALIADKTVNLNSHDCLVMAAAALTRAQKALLKALEPGNHPEEAKPILQEKLRHVRKRMVRYTKSVSQTELNAAVMFLDGELTDVVEAPWARCFAQVVGHSQAERKENVLYRFSSECPSLHFGSLRTAFDTKVFTETSVASDCRTFLFAAVFDGHDGRQCAAFAQSRLWGGFQRHFHISGGNPVVAFQRAFDEIESGFGRAISDEPCSQFAAACSAAVFIDAQSKPQRICVANIGTCRVVHSSGRQVGATQITAEHSCENLSERLRIRHHHPDALLQTGSHKGLLGLYTHTRALGGLHMKDRRIAELWNTQHFRRVHPLPGTTLTNAIGQRRDVAPYLTSRVSIKSAVLEEGDFLIVATSVFWQCFSNENAVLVASRLLAEAREAGASLANVAQLMLAECTAVDDVEVEDDIVLVLITADGTGTAAHNNHDFQAHSNRMTTQPQPEPEQELKLESTSTKQLHNRGVISGQPPPPPPATPCAPVSLQTLSRLQERRGAVTATGAAGRLLNKSVPKPPHLSPPPLPKPLNPHLQSGPSAVTRSGDTAAATPAQRLLVSPPPHSSKAINRHRLDADPTISTLRAHRGDGTSTGMDGSQSVGVKGRSLTQAKPQPASQPQQQVSEAVQESAVQYVDRKRAELQTLLMPHRVPLPASLPPWRPAPPGRSNGDQGALARQQPKGPGLRNSVPLPLSSQSLTLKQRMAVVSDSWSTCDTRTQRSGTLRQRMITVVAGWQSSLRASSGQ